MSDVNENLRTLLTPEQIRKLREAKTDIERVSGNLAILKSMGLDTKELEDHMNWAMNVQKTLLDKFVPK